MNPADDGSDWAGFATPAFQPATALPTLQRTLRDLKLASRSNGLAFDLRGKPVAELALGEKAIEARLVRRLQLTPEWDRFSIDSATAQRRWLDELKKRLARFEHED
jgi:hypothetical protein